MNRRWIYAGAVLLSCVFWGCGQPVPRSADYSRDSYLDIDTAPGRPLHEKQEGTVYVIKKGDTLSEISQRIYGTSRLWRRILEANPGIDPRALRIGQKIIIPPR